MTLPATALGFSVHTGWAQVVALTGPRGAPKLLHRGRVDFAPGSESVEIFHIAAEMALAEAKRHIERCAKLATARARTELAALIKTHASGAAIVAVGVVGNSVMPTAFDSVLRSHLMIHGAEGILYRRAVLQAAQDLKLKIRAIPSKELMEAAAGLLKVAPARLPQWLTDFGRTVGRPWGRDEKDAFLAASLALINP